MEVEEILICDLYYLPFKSANTRGLKGLKYEAMNKSALQQDAIRRKLNNLITLFSIHMTQHFLQRSFRQQRLFEVFASPSQALRILPFLAHCCLGQDCQPSAASMAPHSWFTFAQFLDTQLWEPKVLFTPWKPARLTIFSVHSLLPRLNGAKPALSLSTIDADGALLPFQEDALDDDGEQCQGHHYYPLVEAMLDFRDARDVCDARDARDVCDAHDARERASFVESRHCRIKPQGFIIDGIPRFMVEEDAILLHDSMHGALISKYANPLDDAKGLPGQQELFSDDLAGLTRVLAKQLHCQALFILFSFTLVLIKRLFLNGVGLCYFSYSHVAILMATHVATHAFHVVIRVFALPPISSIQIGEPQGFTSICSPPPIIRCDHSKHFLKAEFRPAPLFLITLHYLGLILALLIIEARSDSQPREQAIPTSGGLFLGGGRFDGSRLRVHSWIFRFAWAQLDGVIGDARGGGHACGSAQPLALLMSVRGRPRYCGD